MVDFDNAPAACTAMGGRFSRVKTADEASKVTALIKEKHQYYAWIPMKKKTSFFTKYRSFSEVSIIVPFLRWSNGSSVTNFTLTFADLAFHKYLYHCITVDLSSGKAKLTDASCSQSKKVLCMESKNGLYLLSRGV